MSIKILDTTLREGEQTPGVSFTIDQKIEIAKLLDEFGVDIIEAGHPMVTLSIKHSIKKIVELNLNAEILAHCRAKIEDINLALECGVDWVGIFFSVSDRSLEERFRKSESEAISIITKAIRYAKAHGLKVRYTPEDTVRSDIRRVIRVSKAAIKAGADRISVADTGGVMSPLKMKRFITMLKKNIKIPINVHCHNDLGMATANSLAAYEAGADLIDVTVNGLGERTGIAPLSEITTALRTLYNVNKWKLDMLPEISEVVERYSGIKKSKQAPIVGENAFTHNAGLHVSALLINPYHYETIPCELVGRKRSIVIDKMASKEAIRYKLNTLNINVSEAKICRLFKEIKKRECNALSDKQLLRMVREV